jgi:ubiquinone/menaquinone biosynthesis C-methylase UbiE
MKCRMADSPAYDGVADAYSRALDPEGLGLVDPILTKLVGDVAGREVLSLACGQGQDARMLAQLGATVTGIDVSEEMLRYACRHEADDQRGITYMRGDAQDLALFANRSFDGVVCHMALMDIPDLAATIAAVARVLRPGGWFVFSIVHPCYGGHVAIVTDYLLEHRYRKHIPPDWLPTHAYHRPLSTYVGELVRVGFRIDGLIEAHHPAADASGVPRLLYARAVKA